MLPVFPTTRWADAFALGFRNQAADDFAELGETSTLADPAVVDDLIENRQNRG